MTGVQRRQLFTDVHDGRCLTVVDDPAGTPAVATVVIAHGLTGDRSGPAELLSVLAAQLCRALRVRVVRFDARGSGDSTGAFHATTFGGMTRDFVDVATAHAAPGGPLVCSGISIGGVPAVLAAEELHAAGAPPVAACVAMSSDLIEGIRFGTEGVTAVRGGEFHLPECFYRERERLRPRTALRRLGIPALLVYGAADDKLAACAPWFAEHGVAVTAVDGDHLFQGSAARAALLDAWTDFLTPVLRAGRSA